jgi:hypothetical protein
MPSQLPLFDAHMHFSREHVDAILAGAEECGVIGGLNIWVGGMYQADYDAYLAECRCRDLRHIVNFWWPDWTQFPSDPDGFVTRTCAEMRRYSNLGVVGLKVWKDLGMYLLHPDGTPATMDDPRFAPIWQTCAELNWVVAVHQADPSHLWNVKTGLSRDDVFTRRNAVIQAHPELTFLLCHGGNDVESIARFTEWMEAFPNLTADLSRELERHDPPERIRAFCERFSDRLYMGWDIGYFEGRGVDVPWNRDEAYDPARRQMTDTWGLTGDTLERIAWRNGQEHWLEARKYRRV